MNIINIYNSISNNLFKIKETFLEFRIKKFVLF